MEVFELIELCEKSIQNTPEGFDPCVQVSVPQGKALSKFRYPFGRSGPKGEILAWGISGGRDIVYFNANELLSFLKKSMEDK